MTETIKATLAAVLGELGISAPDSYVGNSATDAVRALYAAQAAGRFLARRAWRALVFVHEFTTSAGVTAYDLPTDPAFSRLLSGTVYDRTNSERVRGQERPADWQAGEAVGLIGTESRFRIRAVSGTPRAIRFHLLVDPGGAQDLAFEYVTDQWFWTGAAYSDAITADAGTPVFDADVFTAETRWRLLRGLGVPYADEQAEAMRLAATAYGQETARSIDMRRNRGNPALAAQTPEGSWS